nr:probable LRR receptor-like serine/threonine-protein kinase At3g47570 [Aegilops tauschii subsp. strangulata]
MSSVTYLSLAVNNFVGELPFDIGYTLPSIQTFILQQNKVGGKIPASLANATNFLSINLGANAFYGTIPSFGSLSNLEELILASNQLEAGDWSFLSSLANCTQLQVLSLGTNMMQVYKGVLESETNGMIAVKVFKLDQLGAPKSFAAECEAFRNTRHHNLVRVISACSTWDHKGNDFKALIIEYMAHGTLESWIYSETRRPLSLGSRVTITVDMAAALGYLHNSCMPPIVHCDLKPSNVLLDDVMGARLSNFGLAKFLQNHNSSSTVTSTSLAGLRGSIGYIAPEYGIGNKISTAGDVYSYRIIILEMLTGKRPTDELFKNGLSLQKFVGNAFPTKIHEILDPNVIIQNFGDEGVDRNLDQGNHAMVGMLSCIMQLAQLGLSCSTETPKDWPTMPDVYAEISAVKREYCALRVKE